MSLCLLLICVPILSYVFVAIEVAEITEGFSIHPKEGELIMLLNISTMDLKEIILHVIKTFSLNIAITFLGGAACFLFQSKRSDEIISSSCQWELSICVQRIC